MEIRRIPAVQFTYDLWRAGSLTELGVAHRLWAITKNIYWIREMAVGYTEGYNLHVRPKPECIAVMFFHPKLGHFWTHLNKNEFELIMKNI